MIHPHHLVNLYSVSDVAREAGITRFQAEFWLGRYLPRPTHTNGGRRLYYTEAEAKEVIALIHKAKGKAK